MLYKYKTEQFFNFVWQRQNGYKLIAFSCIMRRKSACSFCPFPHGRSNPGSTISAQKGIGGPSKTVGKQACDVARLPFASFVSSRCPSALITLLFGQVLFHVLPQTFKHGLCFLFSLSLGMQHPVGSSDGVWSSPLLHIRTTWGRFTLS